MDDLAGLREELRRAEEACEVTYAAHVRAEIERLSAAPPPPSAPKDEHVAYVAGALGVPEEEAAAMKKADLVELARQAAGG